jgi:hypothetical protein
MEGDMRLVGMVALAVLSGACHRAEGPEAEPEPAAEVQAEVRDGPMDVQTPPGADAADSAAPLALPAVPPEPDRADAPTAPRAAGAGDRPRHEADQPKADDESALWTWTDEEGSTHFGTGSQVPPEARRLARPVNGDVGVVKLEQVPDAALRDARRAANAPPIRSLDSILRQEVAAEKARDGGRPKLPVYDHFKRSRDAAWAAGAGGNTSSVNTSPQECVTEGDITSCRNAPVKR